MSRESGSPDTMRQDIGAMFSSLAKGPDVYQPSKFWEQLNEQNVAQLEDSGLANLKRTLAQNYFTWVVGLRSPLFRHLASSMTPKDWLRVMARLPMFSRESGLGFRRFYENQIFTRMVWIVAERVDKYGFLKNLEEPLFGNPFQIFIDDRLISQDLANSLIELYSILYDRMPSRDESFTVCEIGAGYGRNCFVFLSIFSKCKYIIVDIPPALYVSQEYISKIFPGLRIMKFREFDDFSTISDEFEHADVVFLLPHQASLLPSKSVDYVVNISSFHEMNIAQIDEYFKIIDRLSDGYFYLKQWTRFHNIRDNIVISADDYKYRVNWHLICKQTPATHPLFFEALLRVN